MSRLIRRLTSLNNLAPLGNKRGQIATLLILATVILLIFTMVTLNLGNVAINSTSVANAADSGALYLVSQLSTKSRQLYEGLGNTTEKCQKTGWASFVLAIVVAIIAVVVSIVSFGVASPLALMAIGAVAGAAGGAMGGAIAGTGVAKGALTGACIGAAIGGIGAGIASIAGATTSVSAGAGTAGAGGATGGTATAAGTGAGVSAGGGGVATGAGATYTTTTGGILGIGGTTSAPVAVSAGGVIPAGATIISGTATIIPMTATAAWTGVALGALSVAAAGYNESVAQSIPGAVAEQFTKMLNKMNEPDRIRESVFMQALQLVVDDPTKSYDSPDSNLNGDTLEYVPDFQIWLYNRFRIIGSVTDLIDPEPVVSDFLNNYAWQFENVCKLANEGGDYWQYVGGAAAYVGQPGPLERADYKWVSTPAPTPEDPNATEYVAQAGRDGHIVELLRGLRNAGYPVSFWNPGPTPDQMNEWGLQCNGDVCIDPPIAQGYDELDDMADNLLEMGDFIAALRAQPQNDTIEAWRGWSFFFYDEYDTSNPATYLVRSEKYAQELGNWITEIEAIRTSLPACLFGGPGGDTVLNPPCQFGGGGSIDNDIDDEFYNAYYDLGGMQYEMNSFHGAINGFFTALFPEVEESAYEQICVPPDELNPAGKSCGGKNPVRYEWKDSRGDHEVTVKAVFNVPRLRTYKTGNWFSGKVCVQLLHGAENVQVIASRWDSPKGMGALGTWNPFGGRVTKAAKAYYSYSKQAQLVN